VCNDPSHLSHHLAALRRPARATVPGLAAEDAPTERVALEPVDTADVTIVVDNAIDILAASTELAQRPPWARERSDGDQLRAEHGYCLLATVERAGHRDTLLYDAGLGRDTAAHNLDVLGVNPLEIRAMALSHGHADHHAGLEGLFRRLGRRRMPLVLH